jgi:dienelactone hydrolase
MKPLILALGLLLASALSVPAAEPLVEERTRLPVTIHDLFGDHTYRLDALIVRPNDDRPHPLAVISHGTPRQAIDRMKMSPDGMREQAREFARRGFVAMTFMRRGYGESEGNYAEEGGKCAFEQYVGPGRASADDVRGAIDAMREKSYVDASRIVAAGRSAGGFASVALAAEPPRGLVAVINFAGGRGSDAPDSVCNSPALIDAFAIFGKTARVPMLWVYAENDHYFGPSLSRSFHEAFTGAGGQTEFIMAKPFAEDGHTLFSRDGIAIWTKYVDAFLAAQGLKQRDELLPLRDNVTYPEGLKPSSRDDFVRYLDAKPHKAFALSEDGHTGWRVGRDTADEAVQSAIANCAKRAATPCRAVMIDDRPAP